MNKPANHSSLTPLDSPMPNRFIKESLWSSETLCACSILAQAFFTRLFPFPDDHGCFDARPKILRARLYPLNLADVSDSDIESWLQELIAVDCIRTWVEAGVRYGYVPSWNKHQQIRSVHSRKTPVPPPAVLAPGKGDSDTGNTLFPIPPAESESDADDGEAVPAATSAAGSFDAFWQLWPNKVGKAAALKAWIKINPDADLTQKIHVAVEAAKNSDQWLRDGGRFIPHAATWLNGERWNDEMKPAGVVPMTKNVPRPEPSMDEETKRRAAADLEAFWRYKRSEKPQDVAVKA